MKVVGADDGGVAAHVAEPERTLLEHRDIADTVLSGEIERGRKAVAAAAHDHDAIARARGGPGPGTRPASLATDSLAQQPPEGITAAGTPCGSGRMARVGCIHSWAPS